MGGKLRCCRSTPRCRSCPLVLAGELRSLRELTEVATSPAPHLEGVPGCLHKYEAALRRAWEAREAAETASA